MEQCVSPEGHQWTDEYSRPPEPLTWQGKRAVWGGLGLFVEQSPARYPTTRMGDQASTLVRCARQGCAEIGYRIEEVAQNVSQEGSA